MKRSHTTMEKKLDVALRFIDWFVDRGEVTSSK